MIHAVPRGFPKCAISSRTPSPSLGLQGPVHTCPLYSPWPHITGSGLERPEGQVKKPNPKIFKSPG